MLSTGSCSKTHIAIHSNLHLIYIVSGAAGLNIVIQVADYLLLPDNGFLHHIRNGNDIDEVTIFKNRQVPDLAIVHKAHTMFY